jgi:hypothetical protein
MTTLQLVPKRGFQFQTDDARIVIGGLREIFKSLEEAKVRDDEVNPLFANVFLEIVAVLNRYRRKFDRENQERLIRELRQEQREKGGGA